MTKLVIRKQYANGILTNLQIIAFNNGEVIQMNRDATQEQVLEISTQACINSLTRETEVNIVSGGEIAIDTWQ